MVQSYLREKYREDITLYTDVSKRTDKRIGVTYIISKFVTVWLALWKLACQARQSLFQTPAQLRSANKTYIIKIASNLLK